MKKKGIIIGSLVVAALASAAYAAETFAFRAGDGQFGPNYTPERHAQMTKAFENNDYNAWKGLMGDRGATRVVNEQNFSRFAEMHKLMLDGKTDEANKIRQELGLATGRGQGMMGGQRGNNRGGNFTDKNNDGICDRMQ